MNGSSGGLRASLVVFAALATLTAAGRDAAAQQAGIMVGAMAPTAMVESLDGHALSLSDYVGGKPVVLEFWATWCPLCKKLQPAMEAAKAKYGDRVRFVSVGVAENQTPARQREYREKEMLGGEFVFDRQGEAQRAFQVPHTSFIVVLDASGKVVYTGVGADQDIEAAVAMALGDPAAR